MVLKLWLLEIVNLLYLKGAVSKIASRALVVSVVLAWVPFLTPFQHSDLPKGFKVSAMKSLGLLIGGFSLIPRPPPPPRQKARKRRSGFVKFAFGQMGRGKLRDGKHTIRPLPPKCRYARFDRTLYVVLKSLSLGVL